MKKVIGFLIISLLAEPLYCVQDERSSIEERVASEIDCQLHDGPIMRWINAHPFLSAALLSLMPTIFFCYKWGKAVGKNAELTERYAICASEQHALQEQLWATQQVLEERDKFIQTTFKEVNEKLNLLKIVKLLDSQK